MHIYVDELFKLIVTGKIIDQIKLFTLSDKKIQNKINRNRHMHNMIKKTYKKQNTSHKSMGRYTFSIRGRSKIKYELYWDRLSFMAKGLIWTSLAS